MCPKIESTTVQCSRCLSRILRYQRNRSCLNLIPKASSQKNLDNNLVAPYLPADAIKALGAGGAFASFL